MRIKPDTFGISFSKLVRLPIIFRKGIECKTKEDLLSSYFVEHCKKIHKGNYHFEINLFSENTAYLMYVFDDLNHWGTVCEIKYSSDIDRKNIIKWFPIWDYEKMNHK